MEIIGLEEAGGEVVEFDSIVNCSAQAKIDGQWIETQMNVSMERKQWNMNWEKILGKKKCFETNN